MKLEMGGISLKKTLNQRETVMLIGTLLVGFVGYYKSYAMPAQDDLAKIRNDIAFAAGEKDRLARQLSSKKFSLPERDIGQRQWLSKKEFIEPSIQAIVNPVHLMEVRISGFRSSESKTKEDPFPKRKISLTARGDLRNLGQYVEYIENLQAPLVIEGLSLSADGNQPGNLILVIEGGFYVAP